MALPKFEDWTPPWGDGELDAEKAARLIYNLHADKERQAAQITQLSAERDEFKGKVDEHETAQLSEVEKLRRELEQAKTAPPAVDPLELARYRVALAEGLTERQARRLAGSTEEELAADAAALKEELGITGKAGGEEAPPPPTRRPRGQLQTGLEGGDGEPDVYDPRQLQQQLYPS